MKKIVIGITGASGSIYGKRIIEKLNELGHEIHIIITDNGKKVFSHELEIDFEYFLSQFDSNIHKYKIDDMFAPIASGSFKIDSMIIVPTSMGTMAKIANGISDNLICRTADVCIKEKINLTLVPRETPLSVIHLENMLKLSKIGINMVPPLPSFYDLPKNIDEIIDNSVGRIIKSSGIDNNFYNIWNGGD